MLKEGEAHLSVLANSLICKFADLPAFGRFAKNHISATHPILHYAIIAYLSATVSNILMAWRVLPTNITAKSSRIRLSPAACASTGMIMGHGFMIQGNVVQTKPRKGFGNKI